MFPLRNDPRFERLAVRKRENGFLWLDGFRISHLSVPANMFAAVALEDAHNLDPAAIPECRCEFNKTLPNLCRCPGGESENECWLELGLDAKK